MRKTATVNYIQKLQAKPSFRKYKSFQWADYIELLCLANIDGELSDSDVIDRLTERERDLQEGDPEDIEKTKELEEEDYQFPTRRSEIPDRWKNDLSDWFKVLKLREVLYEEEYPFIVADHEIKLKKPVLTESQKLYIYFLLCSNLYLFDKRSISTLTSSFEIISHLAIKNFLSPEAFAHIFGSNPLNKKGRYNASLSFWDKLLLLSEDLNEPLSQHISQQEYPKSNRGDDGLDLVAWIPTGDSLPSKLVLFAQCACTEEWISKQSDSSHTAWSNKINFSNRVSNTIFIPFCYRKADGTWFKTGDIRESFLIDRKRILFFLKKSDSNFLKSLPAFKLVDKIIESKEDIV